MSTSLTPKERFENKYIPEPMSGCWLWTAGVSHNGYGRFTLSGEAIPATHVSLRLYRNEIVPKHMRACHHCDNPSCVNPDHLFIGTPKENMQDAVRKGRMDFSPRVSLPGESNPSAKLTEKQVLEIIELRKKGVFAKDIAPIYGVGLQIIYNITNGISWRHLNAPNIP